LKQNDTLGIYLPPKHVLWCIERQTTFYGLLCRRALKKLKKKLKKHARWQLHPYPHPISLKRRISILACGVVLG